MLVSSIYSSAKIEGLNVTQEEYILEFNKLLTEYYNTSNDEKLIKFIYNNCIVGIVN